MGRSDYSCFSREVTLPLRSPSIDDEFNLQLHCNSYGVYGALLLEFVCFHRNSYPCDYVTEVEGRVNESAGKYLPSCVCVQSQSRSRDGILAQVLCK